MGTGLVHVVPAVETVTGTGAFIKSGIPHLDGGTVGGHLSLNDLAVVGAGGESGVSAVDLHGSVVVQLHEVAGAEGVAQGDVLQLVAHHLSMVGGLIPAPGQSHTEVQVVHGGVGDGGGVHNAGVGHEYAVLTIQGIHAAMFNGGRGGVLIVEVVEDLAVDVHNAVTGGAGQSAGVVAVLLELAVLAALLQGGGAQSGAGQLTGKGVVISGQGVGTVIVTESNLADVEVACIPVGRILNEHDGVLLGVAVDQIGTAVDNVIAVGAVEVAVGSRIEISAERTALGLIIAAAQGRKEAAVGQHALKGGHGLN